MLLTGGQLRVNEDGPIIVIYLVVKFEGEMDVKGLNDQERERLKREAIERYKKDFGIVNTYVLPLSLANDVCQTFDIAQASNR